MKYKFTYNTVVEIVNVTNIEIQVNYNNFILRWLLDICLSIKPVLTNRNCRCFIAVCHRMTKVAGIILVCRLYLR